MHLAVCCSMGTNYGGQVEVSCILCLVEAGKGTRYGELGGIFHPAVVESIQYFEKKRDLASYSFLKHGEQVIGKRGGILHIAFSCSMGTRYGDLASCSLWGKGTRNRSNGRDRVSCSFSCSKSTRYGKIGRCLASCKTRGTRLQTMMAMGGILQLDVVKSDKLHFGERLCILKL